MKFIQSLLQKYNIIIAKTKYLEEQVEEMKKKLEAFKKAKPKLLADVTKNDKLQANEKEKERTKIAQVESFLTMSISDLKDAIKWRDKTGTDIDSAKDLSLAPSGKKLQEHKIPSFSILPGVTCPNKKECFGWCYAMGGHPMAWKAKSSPARAMQTRYLGISERDDFVDMMNKRLAKTKKDQPFRIHVTGDFHSPDYVKKWIEIVKANPDRKFYAYTKSHQMEGIKELEKLPNMTVRQSVGGTDDDKLDYKKPHCKVFNTKEELDKAGYTECKNDDRLAADKKIVKLGIVKHGTRKYESQFKPYTHAAVDDELPVAHLYDQIDAPHHWSKEEEQAHNELGAEQTPSEWEKNLKG